MPNSKRNVDAVYQATLSPPGELTATQQIARLRQAAGNNLYHLELSDGTSAMAELEAKFRSTIWIKRGSFVLVDSAGIADRDNKLSGIIINVVGNEREWRKMPFWPNQFQAKKSSYADDSDDEGPTMPPSDPEDE
ncbi:nucleic acid-binding protein [Polychaeton citri CBS 116435]|uniref:Nucleic acid-binding protein n=1 Tax=Polychaeton citri CBS 116435 TaxID=1314669 RepID=A0A9P4QB26_9PEZI|nr:nucleic acid-binding protein [Polychaeton citri CBS 116435]